MNPKCNHCRYEMRPENHVADERFGGTYCDDCLSRLPVELAEITALGDPPNTRRFVVTLYLNAELNRLIEFPEPAKD